MAGGSKSKNKGSGYERELGKFFGEIFGGSFIRSANSGAFVGGFNAGRKANLSKTQIAGQKGDLIAPDHMPKFVIEAKFYAEFRFHQLLQPGAMPQLDEWIDQCMDAIDEGDFWVICFKINLRGAYVALPKRFCEGMALGNHCIYQRESDEFVVTDLKTFFTANCQRVLELTR